MRQLALARRQSGAALLLVVLVLLVTFATLLVGKLNASLHENAAHNQRVLSVAKDALIGHALSNSALGKLPCPDVTGDGIAATSCSNDERSQLGLLPWQTLGLTTLRDAGQHCLWYAVSGNFKQSSPNSVNATSTGLFAVYNRDGRLLQSDAIAVVIAPGKAVGGQARPGLSTTCGANQAASSYAQTFLDEHLGVRNYNGQHNGAGAGQPGYAALPTTERSTFIQAPPNGEQANDQLQFISINNFAAVFALIP